MYILAGALTLLWIGNPIGSPAHAQAPEEPARPTGRFDLAEPTPAVTERTRVELRLADQERYLDDWRRALEPPFSAYSFRLALGGAASWLGERQGEWDFALDLEAGVRLGLLPGERETPMARASIGYGLSTGGVDQHLFLLGLGVGWEGIGFSLSWIPRFVAGVVGSLGAVGLRHGVVLELMDLIGIEFAHEVLAVEDGSTAHALRITAVLEMGPVVTMIAREEADYWDER